MQERQIVSITMRPDGIVDVMVGESRLSLSEYGKVLGTAVRIAARSFSNSGEYGDKEAISEMLKQLNRTAHEKTELQIRNLAPN